jgi:hypothetical protein
MKYSMIEGRQKERLDASSKARKDTTWILEQKDYQPFVVASKYGVKKNVLAKPMQYAIYKNNLQAWMDALDFFKEGDVLIIQYPLVNTAAHFEQFLQAAKAKKVYTVALIHDMDSLRYTLENSTARVVKRVAQEDNCLSLFAAVIAHNDSMKRKLESMGCEQIYCLELFDYLCEPGEIRYRTLTNRICIAGNLSKEKAGYISKLASVENLIFHLYGNGFVEENNYNLRYQGAFSPEELVDQIDGSFGLVWDGNELNTCSQGYGSYLRYNNPHKLSLYLAAGMPVIVWNQSALAPFVQEHQVGIAVDSLENLQEALEQLSPATYEGMMEQARSMALDIRKGKWLSEVLDSLEDDINEKTI